MAKKMNTFKIIFSGPVGSGKSTAIAAICKKSVNTDAVATDETAIRKKLTTVAMDYGVLKLDSGDQIHLYGTPGQERFNFMWDILTVGGAGLVLLVDNKRPDPVSDLEYFLDVFKDFIKETAVVIGITRFDECSTPTIQDHQNWLSEKNFDIPVFQTDGRVPKDILKLIEALLCKRDPGIALVS